MHELKTGVPDVVGGALFYEIPLTVRQNLPPAIAAYEATLALEGGADNQAAINNFYTNRKPLLDFVRLHCEKIRAGSDPTNVQLRERCIDALGTLRLCALAAGDNEAHQQILTNIHNFIEDIGQCSIDTLRSYLRITKGCMIAPLSTEARYVAVLGHPNPDTDAITASVFEAFRCQLFDRNTIYFPLVQAHRIPQEMAALLGEELSANLVTWNHPGFQALWKNKRLEVIIVDHNQGPYLKLPTLHVIDHHPRNQNLHDIPYSWEMSGSCTGQIALKLFGMGLTPDEIIAKKLLGATLMDTDNRSPFKMTHRDVLVMDALKRFCGSPSESAMHQDLMGKMLSEANPTALFYRDFRNEGAYSFSVVKTKAELDEQEGSFLVSGLVGEAKACNERLNTTATLIKVVQFGEDNQTVVRERLLLVPKEGTSDEIKKVLEDGVSGIIATQVEKPPNPVEGGFEYGVPGTQLSRKQLTGPLKELFGSIARLTPLV